ncbi:MAG TPA: hypothetical protein EYM39_03675 [Candidatus Latescibacteria bacterium]|nr:hypothetical protein [Candidatus Latescibacterota bacterium]
MPQLTQDQLDHCREEGYVVVPNVIPHNVLDNVITEYEGVLDTLARELYERGEISSMFEDLEFGKRFIKIVIETGDVHKQYFDFSLPFQNVRPDTPFWSGQAVLD